MQLERDGSWSWFLSSSVVGEETQVSSQRHKLTVCVPQLLSNLSTGKKGEYGVSDRDGGRQNGGDAPVYIESGSITNIVTVS